MRNRSDVLSFAAATMLFAWAGVAHAQQPLPPAPSPAPAPAREATSGMVGVPTLSLGSDITIKPRGRLHLDYGDLSGPAGSDGATEGPGLAMRRLRFGAEGDLPGDFTYRLDADFSGDVVEVVDAWVRYRSGPLSLTVGQQNIAQSLEELTSSNDISFMERAAFTDAFGFERQLGVLAEVTSGNLVVQAGVATENLLELGDGTPNKTSYRGRAVWAPRLGDTQLHFGGHVNIRDYAEGGRTIRYRQRGFLNSVDTRFLATTPMLAAHDRGMGLEAAVRHGRWHAQGEVHWNRVARIGTTNDPTFMGWAVETGVFLTDDERGYRGGIFRAPAVENPVTEGGMGALQVNVRYDRLDLNDAGIRGGVQDSAQLSLIWWPVPQVRMMLNYARLDYRDAAVALGGTRAYALDAVGTRLQIAF